MQTHRIVLEHVSKSYGRHQALQDLSLRIDGGLFGLLGRNGAGKSTLMKTLATLLKKQSGNITLCGIPIECAAEVRSIIGYLPQDFAMYPSLSVKEALDYLGVLSGMPAAPRKQRVDALLAQVNLSDVAHKKVRMLSGGMKQRLGIAQALRMIPRC